MTTKMILPIFPNQDSPVNLCVIGLGYVGLPLAAAFARCSFINVFGFDTNASRVDEILEGIDYNKTLSSDELINFTLRALLVSDINLLPVCHVYIITVPTPIDNFNNPDLSMLENASTLVASTISEHKREKANTGSCIAPVVIFESTVYPGLTRKICDDIFQEEQGLQLNSDFFLGYSPERVSPGEGAPRLEEIVKVTSGSDSSTAAWIKDLYSLIIKAGVVSAPSIEVAEAAKILENTQRDVNIALINEVAVLFSRLGIDTYDVLRVATTKWNFLDFSPGLVGGHCISVDPYYLVHLAKYHKVSTDVISASRKVNDNMPGWIARRIAKEYNRSGLVHRSASRKLLMLGCTFKEDCPDIRNSKSIELAYILSSYGFKVELYDPLVYNTGITSIRGMPVTERPMENTGYEIIVLTVKHLVYQQMSVDEWNYLRSSDSSLIFDIKDIVPSELKALRI